MFCTRTVILFVLLAFAFGETNEPEKLDSKDENSSATIANYKGNRNEPINIETSETFSQDNAILIIVGDGKKEKSLLINTGYSVEVRLAQEETNLFISGEAVGNYIFVYTRTIFYWANSVNGVAGTTIDGGKGTPLEISVLFYNTKYRSYSSALNRRDGIVEVRILVLADSQENNEKFEPFAEKFKEIENSENSTEIELQKHNSWYLSFPPTAYYAYPGSLKNASTEETYDCSIDVVIKDPIRISPKQFEQTFLKVKKSSGESFSTAQVTQDQGSRPVINVIKNNFIHLDGEEKLPSIEGSLES